MLILSTISFHVECRQADVQDKSEVRAMATASVTYMHVHACAYAWWGTAWQKLKLHQRPAGLPSGPCL